MFLRFSGQKKALKISLDFQDLSEVPTRFEDSRIFEITVRIGGFAALDICHANTHANLLNFQKTTYNLITSGQIDREAQ